MIDQDKIQIPVKSSPATQWICYYRGKTLYHVLMEDNRPVEVLKKEAGETLYRLDIMLGRVRQVMPALGGAFVDIGDQHDALLPLVDAPKTIKAGQDIMVQIRKQTAAHKGHRVTTRFELPGSYAVLKPGSHPLRRSKLRLFPASERDALFSQDLSYLEQRWDEISKTSQSGPVPRRLAALGDPTETAIANWVQPGLESIRVEDSSVYQSLYKILKKRLPWSLPLLCLHRADASGSLAALLGLSNLDDGLSRRLTWLDNGGSIVIDPTEALTVIDVNSSRDIRGRSKNDLRMRTNLNAIPVIAAQMRLRNMDGMIVIDFLRLKKAEDREKIAQAMKEAVLRDRGRVKLVGFSGLGLFELIRMAV